MKWIVDQDGVYYRPMATSYGAALLVDAIERWLTFP